MVCRRRSAEWGEERGMAEGAKSDRGRGIREGVGARADGVPPVVSGMGRRTADRSDR
jgi:hypothetical protein